MTTHSVPFVDTNIIPDRNAGLGSLLWDLQNPRDPDQDGPPLLDREFAFIDVGVSRARVSIALKALLASDLEMNVEYVATERLEAVPYAHVTVAGDRAEKIRECLSRMISSKQATREVEDWHCVVDHQGKVSSVAYSYDLHGNEVWESYFMGRTFMYSGENVEFSDPELDEMLASDVPKIEARIDLERKRDSDPNQPGASWDGYTVERNPLEAGLAEFGITLQKTDVPQRIAGRQNVLFLGNVLNHYPHDEQARELERIATNVEERDVVIVQIDETETSSIEVLQVKGHGTHKTRERVRWIDTKTLEVQKPDRYTGTWRPIRVKPELERIVSRLVDCLGMEGSSAVWSQEAHKALVHQNITHVFRTFFRALPVERTLRIAVREALRRVPSEGGPKGIPVFKDDAKDAYGGALGLDANPLVSEADFVHFMRIGGDEGWMRRRWTTRALSVMALSFLLMQGIAPQVAAGQAPSADSAAGGPSASELAKQTQNPIASLISFPLEGNWDMGVGDREATSTLLNVQPVIPFAISKSTNVILRVIMPLTSKPTSDADGGRSNGMGDIVFSAFLSPAKSGRIIWGVGPVLLLPTATNGVLGTEKFGIGPTAVALVQPGQWTIGLLANQIWSTSGATDREDVSTTYLQPFIAYNLTGGLSVGVAAEATGNWNASDGKWSSPLLFDVSKVTMLGKRPVKFKFAAGPTFGPAAGPDWRFRFQANFLFPR